jgi:hypothetical protein
MNRQRNKQTNKMESENGKLKCEMEIGNAQWANESESESESENESEGEVQR